MVNTQSPDFYLARYYQANGLSKEGDQQKIRKDYFDSLEARVEENGVLSNEEMELAEKFYRDEAGVFFKDLDRLQDRFVKAYDASDKPSQAMSDFAFEIREGLNKGQKKIVDAKMGESGQRPSLDSIRDEYDARGKGLAERCEIRKKFFKEMEGMENPSEEHIALANRMYGHAAQARIYSGGPALRESYVQMYKNLEDPRPDQEALLARMWDKLSKDQIKSLEEKPEVEEIAAPAAEEEPPLTAQELETLRRMEEMDPDGSVRRRLSGEQPGSNRFSLTDEQRALLREAEAEALQDSPLEPGRVRRGEIERGAEEAVVHEINATSPDASALGAEVQGFLSQFGAFGEFIGEFLGPIITIFSDMFGLDLAKNNQSNVEAGPAEVPSTESAEGKQVVESEVEPEPEVWLDLSSDNIFGENGPGLMDEPPELTITEATAIAPTIGGSLSDVKGANASLKDLAIDYDLKKALDEAAKVDPTLEEEVKPTPELVAPGV